jgi:hypothetical protein
MLLPLTLQDSVSDSSPIIPLQPTTHAAPASLPPVWRSFVDARQRNERNARMGAAETGWLQVGAHSESADFTGKLNKSILRLKRSHFVYEK